MVLFESKKDSLSLALAPRVSQFLSCFILLSSNFSLKKKKKESKCGVGVFFVLFDQFV